MTFTVLDENHRESCESREDAIRRAYWWTTWANRCARMRGADATHQTVYDDVERTITVECAGMTSAYTYPAPEFSSNPAGFTL